MRCCSRLVAAVSALAALGFCLDCVVYLSRSITTTDESGAPMPSDVPAVDGSVLPFPPTPSASTAGYTLGESTHHRETRRARSIRLSEELTATPIAYASRQLHALSCLAISFRSRTPVATLITKSKRASSDALIH